MFRIHIVALRFCDVKNCLDEFLSEAQGRAMTLRPDPANDVDTKAICAYDWQGRHVGYVANYELKEAWQTLRGSGRQSLRGRIVEVNCEHHYVEFECKVETLGESDDLYPATAYLEWNYTGPRLKPTQEMATLDYMMDEINERLNEHETWSDEERCDFMALAMRFCELSRYDLSGEMSDFRRRLCLRLMEIDKEEFRELTEELKMAFCRAGRETRGGKVLNYWMNLVSEPKTIKPLLVCRHKYNIKEVKSQLMCFPESMFEEWLENKDNFVAKLLYMHIPREVLWRFISGIAFYEAVSARQKEEAEVKAAEGGKQSAESVVERNEERFHFIKPEIEDDEAWRIHDAVKRLVAHQRVSEICAYLKELKDQKKVMLPTVSAFMYKELVRLGMPTGNGFSEKHFSNSYMK